MQKTYLFYDIETTGLNKAFDQVLQFAAIRTDLNLNEISRHEFKIKLNCDVIPAPGAIITHQLSLFELMHGMKEIDAIKAIHELLNTPGTISLGFNTLNFDDEFLRFSFYRNLLPPYTHQYANQCSRLDIFPMLSMYYLLHPDVLKWPPREQRISLKLADLAAYNGFEAGRAHDAMNDVVNTVSLAKRLQSLPDFWEQVISFFDKNKTPSHINQLSVAFEQDGQRYREAILIDNSLGFDQQYLCPVIYLGTHQHYKNQTLWLRLDNVPFSEAVTPAPAEYTYVFNKKLGEPMFVLPPSAELTRRLTEVRLECATRNKSWLQEHPAHLQAIRNYYQQFTYPKVPNLDVDAALYDNGFPSDQEQQLCARFHALSTSEKVQCAMGFSNPNLQAMAIRILGRHYHEYLPTQLAAEFAAYLAQINPTDPSQGLIDYRGQKRMTPQQALEEIEKERKKPELSRFQQQLLNELETYLQQFFLQKIRNGSCHLM